MNMNDIDERADDESRRAFIRKAAYVAPMILTLKAVPAFASAGSGQLTDGVTVNDQPSSDSANWALGARDPFSINRRPHHWWQAFWPF